MKTSDMDGQCVIRYLDLPTRIPALVLFDAEGFANIYINASLSYAAQRSALSHELEHVRRGDYDGDTSIRDVESI